MVNQKSLLLATCVLMLDSPIAYGQQLGGADSTVGLGDIVVTARRREEAAQQTPLSVAAVSAATLEQANVQQAADLSRLVAGLVSTPSTSNVGGSTAFIRGIGSTESSLAVDPSIGMYRDGIYLGFSTVSGNSDLTTIERVEVLRGPQGTLFGRNTTGGAINIVTRAPRKDFGAMQMFRYGRFNELQSTTTVDSGELGNSGLSAVATYSHRQRDGYVNDPTRPSDRDPGAYNVESIFAKLHGQWSALTVDYVFDQQQFSGNDAAFQLTAVSPFVASYFANSPRFGGTALVSSPGRVGTLDQRDLPRQRTKSWGHSVTAALNLSDAITLKSITAWRRYDGASLPFAVGNAGLRGLTTNSFVAPVPVDVFYTLPKSQQSRHFTQELQALGDVGAFNYTVGAFYLRQTGNEFNVSNLDAPISTALAFPVSSPSEYSVANRSAALYAQIGYTPDFLEKLELSGGVRVTRDRKSVNQVLTPAPARTGREVFHNTTYALSAKYQWAPDIMTFARIGTGVRAGGFNIRAGAGQDFVFKPEKAHSYEVGLKSELFDRRVRFNASAFYTKYRDLQITTLSGFTNGGLAGQTFNANATYKGGEVELVMAPVSGLTFTANAGYVDATFQQIFFVDPATGLPRNYADQARFPYVPKWNGNAAVDYRFPPTGLGTVAAHLDYSVIGKRWFHAINLPTESPFNDAIAARSAGLFNGRLSLLDIPVGNGFELETSLWVNNITDKEYRVSGIDFGSVGIAGNVYNPPRTYGVDVKVKL